jgi:hypothetical protein
MYHSHFFYSPPENLTYQEAIMFFVVFLDSHTYDAFLLT